MNKEQEIFAVSRLVFELTMIGQSGADLDRLLRQLYGLLDSLPGIRVLPQSAILLYNPRSQLIQVAQFGLEASWEKPVHRENARPERETHTDAAYVTTPSEHHPPLSFPGVDDYSPCFVLPLSEDGQQFGRLLLFIAPDWQPDDVEVDFMTDLSHALSMLVSRSMMSETLLVREVELEDARTDAIRRLGTASEYRDNVTGMHVMRMTHYATTIAKAMGLPVELREMLAICAPMHDVGKIGIADAILLKPGKLTPEEYEVMKTHTEIGERLLEGSDALIAAARDIAAYHHERWDGTGYPYGLAGEAIPVLARICAIADVFDALTSVRPYKSPWPLDEAIAYLRNESGRHFDPSTVVAFDKALPEILRIRELYRDDIIAPNEVVSLPDSAYRPDGWIAWNASLAIGIDLVDEHHRYLFDLTNDLFDVVQAKRGSREVARVLKALEQYAQVHFRAEERMMAHHGYLEETQQKAQHRVFEEKLEEFYAELHVNPLTARFDILLYLREWLIRHIKVEDAKLAVLLEAA